MKALKLAGQVGAVGLVAALLGLLVWKVAHDNHGGIAAEFNRGNKPHAEDFTLKRLNGQGSLQLSTLRGRPVVVNFWASWCEPCEREAPLFQSAFERYRDRVAFIGIDTTDFSGEARSFLTKYGVTYPNVRDPYGRVLHTYGGLPIPRTFVLSRSGRVVGYIFGETRRDRLEREIQKALTA